MYSLLASWPFKNSKKTPLRILLGTAKNKVSDCISAVLQDLLFGIF
jgi:hypothetical protein